MNTRTLLIGTVALVVLAAMVWLAALAEDWTQAFPLKEQKNDYYNLLVDGFQEGHLYMKTAVHPGRLSPDPQVRRQAPYLLDASEYHGRYYLYFGVVPAVLAFWPYAALTGHDLPPNLAVLVAVALAYLVLLRLYREARARYFPTTRAWLDVSATALLAFASGFPVLLVSGGMYEVALSWGCLFATLMFWCLFRALHTERSPLPWLAAASLAFGLGVGSRPTVFLLGPVLPVVAWLVMRSKPAADRGRSLLQLGSAVLGPAGLIGLGLMAYNYARFADPFEFGLHYQVNALAGNGQPLQSPAFVLANLRWYYFTPPTFSLFFPYLFPHSGTPAPPGYYVGSEPTHGQFFVLLLAAALAFAAARFRPPIPRRLGWFLGLLAFGFLALLLATATFAYRSSRYLSDFQPPLILLLVLVAGATFRTEVVFGRKPRAWFAAFVMFGTAAWCSNLLIGFQFLDRFGGSHRQAFQFLAHYGNYPASWAARLGWHHYGPLHFTVVFTRPDKPVYEVLAATGAPGYKDILFASQDPGGSIDLILFHEDYFGAARSRLIPIEYGRPYEMELDMGSLCPPADADYFPRWDPAARAILPTVARVVFDGTEVIRTRQRFHESSPGLLTLGRAPGRPERPFSGRISEVRRLPLRDAAARRQLAEPGVWRIELELPDLTQTEGQPLLSSGVTGRGNLLLMRNLPDGRIQFGVDFWGVGAADSPPLPRPAAGRHVLELFAGSQVNRQAAHPAQAAEVLRVWLDGQPVWTTPLIAHQDSYDFVGIGTNPQDFSTAQPAYAGLLRRVPLSPAEVRALVEKNLALARP